MQRARRLTLQNPFIVAHSVARTIFLVFPFLTFFHLAPSTEL
jgi:hypothetical protein